MAIKALAQEKLGRYRILEELGRGAMGVVHKAEDPLLDRVVAIKVVELSPDAFDSQEYEARFYQEAKAAGSLNHRGIISIYDTGRDGNWAYIAMELLEGEELRGLMAADRMPIARVLDIAAQVAEALAFAHRNGVVHRDIKPANIMILSGDHAKIMDFGIARTRISTVETQVGVVLGSPKYMSPEQVVGKRVDHRSDIFSLGVMLFEMVAGISPYSGKDISELMYAVVNTREARVSQFNPAAPEMLDLIVAKALQKDVAARYQSAGEFAADLDVCRAALSDTATVLATTGEATLPLATAAGAAFNLMSGPMSSPMSTPMSTLNVAATPSTGATGMAGEASAERGLHIDVHSAKTVTTVATATTVTAATLPDADAAPGERGQLIFSRRFNSAKALARLADPSPEDAQKLSKMPAPAKRLDTLRSHARNRHLSALIVAAVFGAIAIALL